MSFKILLRKHLRLHATVAYKQYSYVLSVKELRNCMFGCVLFVFNSVTAGSCLFESNLLATSNRNLVGC